MARRPPRRHPAPAHPRHRRLRSAAVAGRVADRLRAWRRQGQGADPRGGCRGRGAGAGHRCPARRRELRLVRRRRVSGLHRTRSRGGPLWERRGAGCRGRGASPHHRRPVALQWTRLHRGPTLPSVHRGGAGGRRRAVLRARRSGAPGGRGPSEEEAGRSRGTRADLGFGIPFGSGVPRRGGAHRRRRDRARSAGSEIATGRRARRRIGRARADRGGLEPLALGRRGRRGRGHRGPRGRRGAVRHRLRRSRCCAVASRRVRSASDHGWRDDRPRRGRQPHHRCRRRLPRSGPHPWTRAPAAGDAVR